LIKNLMACQLLQTKHQLRKERLTKFQNKIPVFNHQ